MRLIQEGADLSPMSEMGSKPAGILGEALLDTIRQAVREEIAAAIGQNAHNEVPKLLYNTKEAATLLSVPETWLARAARRGEIRCVRLGHYVNFSPEDLKAFLEEQKKENA